MEFGVGNRGGLVKTAAERETKGKAAYFRGVHRELIAGRVNQVAFRGLIVEVIAGDSGSCVGAVGRFGNGNHRGASPRLRHK